MLLCCVSHFLFGLLLLRKRASTASKLMEKATDKFYRGTTEVKLSELENLSKQVISKILLFNAFRDEQILAAICFITILLMNHSPFHIKKLIDYVIM